MQSITPLRLRPIFQRICCLNEAHRSSRASTSKFNRSLVSVSIPEKPRRPGNAFLQFIKDVEEKLYNDKPGSTRREIMVQAGTMWRDADDDLKSRYNDVFKKKNREYEEKLEAYKKNLTHEQKAAIAELEQKYDEKRKSNKYRRALKELGKPTRPPSGYGLFLKKHGQGGKNEGESNKDRLRRLSTEWRELQESEKEHFHKKAEELLNDYIQDMRQWEKSMLEKLDADEEEIQVLTEKIEDGRLKFSDSKKLNNRLVSLLEKKKKDT